MFLKKTLLVNYTYSQQITCRQGRERYQVHETCSAQKKTKQKKAPLEGYKMHVKEQLKDGAMNLVFLLHFQETKITFSETAYVSKVVQLTC
uniref:Uncharacterized protein n=1 Tax=Anguilla anguilla TaxID=7936 RepID=A0A0E9X554_ANGAN